MNARNSGSRGFAALAAILIVVAVAALGGGAYYYSSGRANLGSSATTTSSASLRSLIARGQDLECEFTHRYEGGVQTGTVFIADGKMRGDFTAEVEGSGRMTSHLVHDGQYAYVWSDAMAGQGAKVRADIQAGADVKSQAQGAIDLDENVEYDCDRWNVDEDKFELPSGIQFTDVSAMAGAAAQAGAGASAGANVGASASVKAEQCAACESLPEIAQGQCRAALGC